MSGRGAAPTLFAPLGGNIPVVTISGAELCKISDFHRRKVLDEVKQAHERVINTCNDSDKFNAAEKRFWANANNANAKLDTINPNVPPSTYVGDLFQILYWTLGTVDSLRDMRRWSVQASFDTVALDDWRVMAAAIRNTCGVDLPGSNANDNTRLQESFNCAKSLIPRFVSAERAYFKIIKRIDGRITFPDLPSQNSTLSDWFDATYTDPNNLFNDRSITNFDEYLQQVNALTLAQAGGETRDNFAGDAWKEILIKSALARGGSEDIAGLGGLSGANPGALASKFPETAYNIIKYGKKFVDWVIDLGRWGSGVKYDKQEIIDAANDILKRVQPKPPFTLQVKRYDEIIQLAQIASSNAEAFKKFTLANQWWRYEMPSLLNADHKLSEQSMERVVRQIYWQFMGKCHEENPSYSVAQCVVYAWDMSCKFGKAIPGFDSHCANEAEKKPPQCTITYTDPNPIPPRKDFSIEWTTQGGVADGQGSWKRNDGAHDPPRGPDNSFIDNFAVGKNTGGGVILNIHKNGGDKPSQLSITVNGPGGASNCASPEIKVGESKCPALGGEGGKIGDKCHPTISVEQ